MQPTISQLQSFYTVVIEILTNLDKVDVDCTVWANKNYRLMERGCELKPLVLPEVEALPEHVKSAVNTMAVAFDLTCGVYGSLSEIYDHKKLRKADKILEGNGVLENTINVMAHAAETFRQVMYRHCKKQNKKHK